MPSVRDESEIKYVRFMGKMLRNNMSTESDKADFSCCCLPRPFSFFYLIREVRSGGPDLDLELQQRSRGLLVF